MGSYGDDSGECEEAQANYDQLKEELGRQIGLGMGFEGLRSKLGEWEEDKQW